jgi:hypothetical protein
MKRYAHIDIFKHEGENYSAGGISSQVDHVNIVTDLDPNDTVQENDVVLIETTVWGKPDIYAVPAKIYMRGDHSMFGGCFIYTSNGIVPHSGEAIRLHDRQE